ncbi:MAG: histone deacetylase [Syntrophobacteraceae bacterium]
MRRTGFLYDERFLLHNTGPGHPECPERLSVLYRGLDEAGLLAKLVPIPAVPAKIKWIEMVHSPRHVFRVEEACLLDLGELDNADNQLCPETFDTAVLAVGGVLNSADFLMEGKVDNAFCAVRPPGHHAEPNKALGFCYFNNIAIAAKYLQTQWKVSRIAIIDVDVHHGNGTQHIFEEDPGVFYYSIHEHPSFSYPGTGREFEKGSGPGYGMTLNSTILPGQGDEQYKHKFQRDLIPAIEYYRPEVILVSAGFDAHIEDDMSEVKLTTECYAWIARQIVEIADRYSGGRIISVLEGGYCLKVLPRLVRDHVSILLGE